MSGVVEVVSHSEELVLNLVNCVFLLDDHGWSSEEVKGSEKLLKLDGLVEVLEARWKFYIDVGGAFWKDDLHLVILGQRVFETVHILDLKGMEACITWIREEMVLGWHVVPHVPVCLPLSKERESEVEVEVDEVVLSLCVRAADVANIVVVVKVMDVVWKLGLNIFNSVGSVFWVDVWLVINSAELSVDASGVVVHDVVLIDGDVTPVRHKDVSG